MTGILQGVIASIGGVVVKGQEAFTTEGTFTWVAPTGVTKVSTVVVGSGKAANGQVGGALSYKNNISVSPGSSYTVFVSATRSTRSYFINSCTVSAGGACARTGDGGGNGLGGAGGYSGNGGANPCTGCFPNGSPGSGGGGGGGGLGFTPGVASWVGGGGGVGLLGEGSSGAGGTGGQCVTAQGGGGGSGGTSGGNSTPSVAGSGGLYGGAPGFCPCFGNGTGGRSAIRIIWPGCARSFPSTRTANE